MCSQLLSDIHQEAEGTMPDEAALNSGAADNDGDDEGGPMLLPNGVPLSAAALGASDLTATVIILVGTNDP
jgi:hypothetical protein